MKILFFLILLISSVATKQTNSDYLPIPMEGKPLPEFSAPKLIGPDDIATIITNADIKGPALVNIWSTWNPMSQEENKTLNELKAQGVNIYGVNYKDDPKLAYEWLQNLGNPYLFNFLDMSGAVGIELGVYGAPETFFVDKNNVIQYRHVGAILPDIWNSKLKAIYESLDTQGAQP